MTCEDFRRTFKVSPRHVTRGTRAAMVGHALACRSCYALAMSAGELPPDHKAVIEDMSYRDCQDPEYVATVKGQRDAG